MECRSEKRSSSNMPAGGRSLPTTVRSVKLVPNLVSTDEGPDSAVVASACPLPINGIDGGPFVHPASQSLLPGRAVISTSSATLRALERESAAGRAEASLAKGRDRYE